MLTNTNIHIMTHTPSPRPDKAGKEKEMNDWTYQIYLHEELVDETPLSGIAFLKFESAKLLGFSELHEIYTGPSFDPVLHRTIIHRGGIHPPCSDRPQKCEYRKSMSASFYGHTRPTSFRTEVVCPSDRCGYMIKLSRLGGNFFDYAPCIK
jgi:hypothetical protein